MTFKVATWNIRSGMGIHGFLSTAKWDSNTLNCTDGSKPMNAWGLGLPQRELEHVRADAGVVAMALQEAWNCGNTTNVNTILGFRTATRELNGIALLARHGFAGAPTYQRISATQWLIGGSVCLDVACSATLPIYTTHWDGGATDDFVGQAQAVVDYLAAQPVPQLFLGDLNVYQVEQWNPRVPCTGDDVSGRVHAIGIVESAGYTDAWKASQSGEGWTGMASRPGCGSPSGNLFKRIDRVYVKGLQVRATSRFGRADPGADSPSDHVGLLADLLVPLTAQPSR